MDQIENLQDLLETLQRNPTTAPYMSDQAYQKRMVALFENQHILENEVLMGKIQEADARIGESLLALAGINLPPVPREQPGLMPATTTSMPTMQSSLQPSQPPQPSQPSQPNVEAQAQAQAQAAAQPRVLPRPQSFAYVAFNNWGNARPDLGTERNVVTGQYGVISQSFGDADSGEPPRRSDDLETMDVSMRRCKRACDADGACVGFVHDGVSCTLKNRNLLDKNPGYVSGTFAENATTHIKQQELESPHTACEWSFYGDNQWPIRECHPEPTIPESREPFALFVETKYENQRRFGSLPF